MFVGLDISCLVVILGLRGLVFDYVFACLLWVWWFGVLRFCFSDLASLVFWVKFRSVWVGIG